MPAMLTHDQFGQDAFGTAIETVPLYTPDERNAFLLGNQGPDPLFYLLIVPPMEEFRVLGSDMHHVPPSKLFVSMRKAMDALPEQKQGVGRAYLAGFTCHYLLDRAVHPFVYFWERGICQAGVKDLDTNDSGEVHAEIERDLDEMVLFTKRNQTIETYRPYLEVLRGSEEMLEAVGDLYFDSVVSDLAEGEPTANKVFPLAVHCFRIVQRAFWSPRGGKTAAFERMEGLLHSSRYSLVRAMSHRPRAELTSSFDNRDRKPWRDPFTGETRTESFWDLYDGALEEVAHALPIVFENDFDIETAYALTHGLNFCGERVE